MEYLTNPPKPTDAQLLEISRLEADIKRVNRLEDESWERSGQDGFLSQWAHGMTARLNEAKIKLLRTGNHSQFSVLMLGDQVIADMCHQFINPHPRGWGEQVQHSWKLPDNLVERFGRRWVPVGHNSRIQKKLGLHEESRWFPAIAEITGSGTGLSGCASAHVIIRRNK